MGTFKQWLGAGCPVRRVTYVCGPEPVLAEEVVAAVRADFGGEDRTVLVAGDDHEADIWSACAQYPMDADAGRLVIVRDAARLKRWDDVPDLLETGTSRLLFVSAEDDYARKSGSGKRELLPHLAPFRDSRHAQLIKCVAPGAEDLTGWVQRIWPGCGITAAFHLLTRAGGEVAMVRDVAAKAAAARLEPTERTIDGLLAAQPGAEFIDCLLARRRPDALRAAARLSEPAVLGVLARLDGVLDTLARLQEAMARRLDGRDIAVKYRVPAFVARKYREIAPQYGPAEAQRCRSVLVIADDTWRSGVRDGVLEALVAVW